MSVPKGFDRGTTFTGPLWVKRKPAGSTREIKDRIAAATPRLGSYLFEDFDGPIQTFTLTTQLFTDSGVTEQATTGTQTGYVYVPRAGRLVSARIIAEDGLTADDTNYVTFAIANKLASGSGSTAMLAATDANTTKATGGTGITAVVGRSLTVNGTAANLRVAAGDVLAVTSTATGTLDNAIDQPKVVLTFATLPNKQVPLITHTAGSPLVGPVDDTANGEAICQLSATNEANVAGWYLEDQLLVDPTKGPIFCCRLKVSAVATATRFIWGLISAYTATLDNITSNVMFRLEGNSLALLAESDDGTTDSDDQSTSTTLTAATYNDFRIDMTDLANIEFWVDDTRVATLAASALTASTLLQPVCLIQKDSGTGEQSITMDWWSLEYARR